jgi:hypothetical protein
MRSAQIQQHAVMASYWNDQHIRDNRGIRKTILSTVQDTSPSNR